MLETTSPASVSHFRLILLPCPLVPSSPLSLCSRGYSARGNPHTAKLLASTRFTSAQDSVAGLQAACLNAWMLLETSCIQSKMKSIHKSYWSSNGLTRTLPDCPTRDPWPVPTLLNTCYAMGAAITAETEQRCPKTILRIVTYDRAHAAGLTRKLALHKRGICCFTCSSP